MKSDVIMISGKGDPTEAVLSQAERVAVHQNLSNKNALHLRLLAEEMTSMVRAIAGEVNGEFWIENEGKQFELHLHVKTPMDFYKRERLLSAASTGKNEAERGLMGKIRSFFEPTDGVPVLLDISPDGMGSDMVWTMRAYQHQVQQYVQQNLEGAAEAWDELEKSVVTHVADDVKVCIRGRDVEMTIFKKLA
jgi:hypothetical protein